MVSEEILRQLEWRGLDCGAFFYRTSAGAEIDLVLEGDVGLVPIEIKSTHTIDRRAKAGVPGPPPRAREERARGSRTAHQLKHGCISAFGRAIPSRQSQPIDFYRDRYMIS